MEKIELKEFDKEINEFHSYNLPDGGEYGGGGSGGFVEALFGSLLLCIILPIVFVVLGLIFVSIISVASLSPL